jgi:copper(I)-binding protein
MRNTISARRLGVASLALIATLTLAACGNDDPENTAEPSSAQTADAPDTHSNEEVGLTVTGQWVKAADSGMTAAFGTIANDSDHPVTITGVDSPAADDMQLHETVTGENGTSTMREKEGGFTIQPGEELNLEPGGNHLMFMDLSCSLLAGDDIDLTLQTEDGHGMSFEAPIRDYSAAQENYDPSAEESGPAEDHSDHGMEGADHSEGDMEGTDHSEHAGSSESSMDMGMGDPAQDSLPSCSE